MGEEEVSFSRLVSFLKDVKMIRIWSADKEREMMEIVLIKNFGFRSPCKVQKRSFTNKLIELIERIKARHGKATDHKFL